MKNCPACNDTGKIDIVEFDDDGIRKVVGQRSCSCSIAEKEIAPQKAKVKKTR
jgi:hypothetical protein